MARRAVARVNLAAIERNVARLCDQLSSGTELCAVVKGNAFGHGAIRTAQTALLAGATLLAVATPGEATELRAGGITAPILILGAISDEELDEALGTGSEIVAWTNTFVSTVADMIRSNYAATRPPVGIHLKVDTGMGRFGTRTVDESLSLACAISTRPEVRLVGVMTHMATAHNDLSVLRQQLSSFQDTVDIFKEKYGPLQFHAANSAATIRSPESHFDMVRCGIALYGCDPLNTDPALRNLEPALELSSYVAALKVIQRGDAVGYSQRFVADYATWVATIPIGYADGVRRDLANNGEVLIEGCRYPIVGTVSMDNITVELGPGADAPVALGTHAVLIGRSGDDLLTAESIANRAGTISNEILCAISSRVLRTYHRDGQPA